MSEEKTITIKKDDLWKYSTFLLLAVLVIAGVFAFTGNGQTTGQVAQQPTQPSAPSQPSKVEVDAGDSARIGNSDAPVEIIEFSDFECPFCQRAAPTVKQILAEYGDDVTFVYRHFPLDSIHPMATPAAVASECVREQGGDEAFFEYHDLIFERQSSLSSSNLKSWAQEIGHNIDSCLDSQKHSDRVQKDLQDAIGSGGQGTPYFVINGKPLSGAQPFNAFKQIIDAELA